MIIVSCGLWTAALLLITFGIDRVYANVLMGKAFRLFMIPGAVVHHVSQAVACVLTGAPVKSIKFVNIKESTIQHSEPKVPGIGSILIALAPVVGCGAMLAAIPMFFRQPLHIGPPLPVLPAFSVDAGSMWAKSFIDVCTVTLKYFGSAQYSFALIMLCYLGLVFSIAVGMDVRGLKFSLGGVAAVTGAAYLADGMSHSAVSSFASSRILPLLSFAVPVTTLFMILSLFLAGLATLLRKRNRHQQSRDEIREKLAKLAET